MNLEVNLGAVYHGNGLCSFRVWAPYARSVAVHVVYPRERLVSLRPASRGYHRETIEGVSPGALYFIRLDGRKDYPDPASRYQPRGVHGPSQVLDHEFPWEDARWAGLSLDRYVFYEIHVGTFTPEGTFAAVIPRLDELAELGVTSIEVMPVSQFPGSRNWGYDGVQPFAVQNSYGGPDGLKGLVDACHKRSMTVTLDVVYNHFGPEGNYLREFGPYFTDKYRTPWGDAMNFDDAHSDEVREYFLQNAVYWLDAFHIDALRLDAVHAIFDRSATPFLRELAGRIDALRARDSRKRCLVAESDLNDSRLIRSWKDWGYGLDAQWSDDFHHGVHALLTGEKDGYYADFGKSGQVAKAMREGYVYSGEYSAYRLRSHGNYSADIPADRFVIATQNHDQVGNRMLGERLSSLISFEAEKLAAGALILSPGLPLLFMGQEYGESAPFLYFVSHTDPELVTAVRKGRKEEFREFSWKEEPPDPAGEETFHRSFLSWEKRKEGRQGILLAFYTALLRFRKNLPALQSYDRGRMEANAFEDRGIVLLKRWSDRNQVLCIFNFGTADSELAPGEIADPNGLEKLLDSSGSEWEGPGTLLPDALEQGRALRIRAHSMALYARGVVA